MTAQGQRTGSRAIPRPRTPSWTARSGAVGSASGDRVQTWFACNVHHGFRARRARGCGPRRCRIAKAEVLRPEDAADMAAADLHFAVLDAAIGARSSIQAPMALRLGPGIASASCTQLPATAVVLRQSCAGSLRFTTTMSRSRRRSDRPARRRAPAPSRRHLPCRRLQGKVPSARCRSRLLGSFSAKSGIFPDVALDHEKIGQAIIVHVAELRVPGGGGRMSPPV